jgi:Ig domain of plant-specific actin-binding protein
MGSHCTALGGATSHTRMLGGHDVGHTIGLQVKATDSKGSTTAYTGLVGPVAGTGPLFASLRQPTVSGVATPGGTIKVDAGIWEPHPTSFVFQWARCDARAWSCTPIKGATSAEYAVKPGDLGHSLVAIVDARAGTISRAVFSVAAAASAGNAEATGPANSAPPYVAQGIQVGSQLTGHTGSWSGSGSIRYAYQWYRCDTGGAHCSAIHGATKLTYLPTTRDAGHTLGLAIAANDAAGTTTAYASLIGPIAAARAPIVSTGQATIAGTPAVGQTLQVSSGSWSTAPTSVSYQWERCNRNGRICAPISGAASSSYATTADDVGSVLVVVVHAAVGSASQDAFSAETSVITPAPGPSSTAPPTLTGTAQAGKQLDGTDGTWAGTGTITYGYQWYRCDSSGAHCSSIHGATKQTYAEVDKDVGQTIAFAVRATDAVGTTTLYTGIVGPTAAASSALTATAQPAVTGTAQQGQTLQAGSGSWTVAPSALGYQWLRCNANGRLCGPINGATAATYVPTADDAGHALVVLVQATVNGATQGALSGPTAVVR